MTSRETIQIQYCKICDILENIAETFKLKGHLSEEEQVYLQRLIKDRNEYLELLELYTEIEYGRIPRQ